jgi:hypothetical protein
VAVLSIVPAAVVAVVGRIGHGFGSAVPGPRAKDPVGRHRA